MDRRKLLMLIALVFGSALIAIAIYFVFFKGAEIIEPTVVTPTGPGAGLGIAEGDRVPGEFDEVPIGAELPTIPLADEVPTPVATGGLTITKELVGSDATKITFSSDDDAISFYDPLTGLFKRILPDGSQVVLNDTPLPQAKEVEWGNNPDKAIVEFPDGANVLYDFETQEQRTLPQHWTDFDFSPEDSSIAAKNIGYSPENRFLTVSNPDGSGSENIEYLGNNAHKVDVSWSPNNQVIAFSKTGKKMGLGREEILLVGKNNENFPGVVVEGMGFQPKWSPKGDVLLYSVFNSENGLQPELWIVNSSPGSIGDNRVPLGITTWADKCAFTKDNKSIYCAVPDEASLNFGIGFAPSLADNTNDSVYKIDLVNGRTSLIGKPENDFTISQIVVSDDESKLFFTDKIIGSLQEMLLK